MDFSTRLSEQLKQAMKSKDQVMLTTVRGLKAKVKEREIAKGAVLEEPEFIKIVQTAVKQHREAIDLYAKGGRQDLVASEEAELKILEDYLPKMMTPEEMRALVDRVVTETGASSMADMGKVMKPLMEAAAGRGDGKLLQQYVREKLG